MISKRLHPASFSNVNAQLAQKAPLANPTFTGLVTTAGQIKFPATLNASADANTLDDYEEGTFSPVITGTTDAGIGTYTQQFGKYVKIGKIVQVQIRLAWTAHTGTGNLTITGLPFATGSDDGSFVPCNLYTDGIALSAGYTVASHIVKNSTVIIIRQINSAGSNSAVPIDTVGTIYAQAIYICEV